jgi:hypothetical protein
MPSATKPSDPFAVLSPPGLGEEPTTPAKGGDPFAVLEPPAPAAAPPSVVEKPDQPSFSPTAGILGAGAALGGYGLASGATRAANAVLGNWDPAKAGAMAMRERLAEAGIPTRIGDLTGLPGPAKEAGFSPAWRGLENFTQNYIPFSGASGVVEDQANALKNATTSGGDVGDKTIAAIQNAWQARENAVDQLYKDLDSTKTVGTVSPDSTMRGLKNFVKQYGPSKLASIPDKPVAAKLLMLAGYPDKAAAQLSHWSDRAAATYINNTLAQMQQGMSFEQFRDLQKSIGQVIGHFSGDIGKPTPPEQGAMKGIYARMYGDLNNFGLQNQTNSDFMNKFKQAQNEFKATQNFYDNNPFLRNVVKGNYDTQGIKLLQDFTNPANYQKVSPLASYVQPQDYAAFFGPQIADRGTDQLVRTLTKEPTQKLPWSKIGELAGAITASNAMPSIYGGWGEAAHVHPGAIAAALLGQTLAGRAINSTSVAPRLWGAANPLQLAPVSESPVLSALKKVLRYAKP